MIKEDTVESVIVLSKKILSRQSKLAHILYQLNLAQRNTDVESDSTLSDDEPEEDVLKESIGNMSNNDYGKNVLKESKDNMSNNSQGAVNSGHGKAKENNKGKKKG